MHAPGIGLLGNGSALSAVTGSAPGLSWNMDAECRTALRSSPLPEPTRGRKLDSVGDTLSTRLDFASFDVSAYTFVTPLETGATYVSSCVGTMGVKPVSGTQASMPWNKLKLIVQRLSCRTCMESESYQLKEVERTVLQQ